MSHKHNGVKPEAAAPKITRKEAGDETHSNCSSHAEPVVIYPENIQKRLNALKHTHMEIQKLEQEMNMKIFQAEAQIRTQMAPLLKKRAEIIAGTYEPTANEVKFELKEGLPAPETMPNDGKTGIPKFWLQVLTNCMHTNEWVEEHDEEVFEFLTDIRVVYDEKPLGFKLEFEFAENPFFTNKVLTRAYVFDEALPKEELYVNNGLTPKATSGTTIDWKEGKNLTKKITISQQRNKKTGERRQQKIEKDQDTFFTFFTPTVTDLAALMKPVEAGEGEEHVHEENIEKIQQAEMEYEMASLFRSRVVPRALLIFTGEDEDDGDFSDDDYDEEEESDDDDDEKEEESKSESSDEDVVPGKKGKGPPGKGSAGKAARR